MEILLVATEPCPRHASTDMSDELFALARTFRHLGHDVTIVAPSDSGFERDGLAVARRLTPLELGSGRSVTIYDAQLSTGVKLVLLGVFNERTQQLHSVEPIDAVKLRGAVAFASAVVAFIEQRAEQAQPFEVVHLYDWTAALVGLGLRSAPRQAGPAIVQTVHDVRRNGCINKSQVGIADTLLSAPAVDCGEAISLLQAGVRSADAVIVPSESHAEDWITHGSDASGLSAVFSERRSSTFAVTGGVDYARVNPSTNPALAARYDAEDATAKVITKVSLQRELGLEIGDRPLFLLPGPMTEEAGSDIVLSALDALLEQPISLCVWSTPNDPPELVAELARRIAGRSSIAAHQILDCEDQVHRGFAAADFVVYPARTRDGQVGHLAAQRYGAVVVGLEAPGLRDAIVDCDAGLETGTGFLFSEPSARALVETIARAQIAYRHAAFARLRRRVMRQDYSWERPARRILQIYKKVCEARLRAIAPDA